MKANWVTLPSLILIEIFYYLNPEERIQASSVCKAWRPCLFYAKFWNQLNLKFYRNASEFRKSTFLRLNIPFRYLQDMHIVFSPDRKYVNSVLQCLELLTKSLWLKKLVLHSSSCVTIERTKTSEITIEFFSRLNHWLKEIVTNTKYLEHLDLGYLEELVFTSQKSGLLDALIENHSNTLKWLNLASMKQQSNQYFLDDIPTQILVSSLTKLNVLHLNYESLNNSILDTFCQPYRNPLKQLIVIVQSIDAHQPAATTNDVWTRFVTANPECQLELVLIHSAEAVALLRSQILLPAMPLTKLSTLFCQHVDETAFDFLSLNYTSTFRSLCVIDSLFLQNGHKQLPNLLQTDPPGGVDPLIMLAWKCRRLESITLIGYRYSSMGLVGIARLCGPQLKELVIPEVCIDYDFEGFDETPSKLLVKTVSQALNRQWLPLKTSQLNLAIVKPTRLGGAWDSFVLNRLLSASHAAIED